MNTGKRTITVEVAEDTARNTLELEGKYERMIGLLREIREATLIEAYKQKYGEDAFREMMRDLHNATYRTINRKAFDHFMRRTAERHGASPNLVPVVINMAKEARQ